MAGNHGNMGETLREHKADSLDQAIGKGGRFYTIKCGIQVPK